MTSPSGCKVSDQGVVEFVGAACLDAAPRLAQAGRLAQPYPKHPSILSRPRCGVSFQAAGR